MAGIGGFGRFMIPFTAGATTGMGTYNALQQQGLQNKLAQQQMMINEQRMALERAQQGLQANELQFNQGQEMFNVLQQGRAARAGAAMFTKRALQATDPQEQSFWNGSANYLLNGGSMADIGKLADQMGYSNQMKRTLMESQIEYNEARARGDNAQAAAIASMFPGIDTSGGGGGLGGTAMPGHTGVPSVGYGGGMSAGAGAGAPSAGGSLGALGSPVGTTKRYRHTIIPKNGQYYYVDDSGNVYGPIPMAGAGVAGAEAGAGAPADGGMASAGTP